jgi:hypothetical protein
MQIIEDAVREICRWRRPLRNCAATAIPICRAFTAAVRGPSPPAGRTWTPQQEQALAKIINIDETRRVWMGSLEITELIRRRLAHDFLARAFGISVSGVSSCPARSGEWKRQRVSGSTSTPN